VTKYRIEQFYKRINFVDKEKSLFVYRLNLHPEYYTFKSFSMKTFRAILKGKIKFFDKKNAFFVDRLNSDPEQHTFKSFTMKIFRACSLGKNKIIR
jgi:hypothetical protein